MNQINWLGVDRSRVDRIRYMAAGQVESARSWLELDERGTWSLAIADLLDRLDPIVKAKGGVDADLDYEIAVCIAYEATIAMLNHAKRESPMSASFSIQMLRHDALTSPAHMSHFFTTSLTGDTVFCGYTHCKGECGYPALLAPKYWDHNEVEAHYARTWGLERDEDGRPYSMVRARGVMVAYGPVFATADWSGDVVVIQHPDVEKFTEYYWR